MRYKIFGQHTGLRVSEFALGAGNFGNSWGYGAEPAEARRMFDGYVDAGGNFLDTGDVYQFGQSESLIGEFVAGMRDEFVIASKYTGGAQAKSGLGTTGNNRKSMVQAVEATLKRLKTDRIDIYWVHYPDGVTPIDEIARGLDDLVRAGKIIYSGLSNFPAWRTARAATLAELRGWAPVAGVQLEYSLVERTAEREMIPMAQAYGMGMVAWGIYGGGLLTGKYRRGEVGRVQTMGAFAHSEDNKQRSAILNTVEAMAEELGVSQGQVAIAWVNQRGVIPILGPRSREHLDDALLALNLVLSDEQMRKLTEVSCITLGFPYEMLISEVERKKLHDPKLAAIIAPQAFR